MKTQKLLGLGLVGASALAALAGVWLDQGPSVAVIRTASHTGPRDTRVPEQVIAQRLQAHAARKVAADEVAGGAGGVAPIPYPPVVEALDANDDTGPLEARWQTEDKDARLAKFEGALRTVMGATDVAGSRMVSVDCRTTLCRTELVVASASGTPMRALWELGRRAEQDPTLRDSRGRHHIGKDNVVIFTAPPGMPLDSANVLQ